MSEPGEIKTCRVCHNAWASSENVVCQACHIHLSPETHYGRWDTPGPSAPPDQTGHRQNELSVANLSRHLDTFQNRTEVIRRRRRDEVRTSYLETLHERKVEHGESREDALKFAREVYEQDSVFESVVASEEADYQNGAREDARCQVALRYRQLLRNRMEVNRESRDEAVAWVRQHMADESDISDVAASEEAEDRANISSDVETLFNAYERCLRNFTCGERHSREESLEWGRRQLGHYAKFAEVVVREEAEYQSYLRDEERKALRGRYRIELQDRMENDHFTREEALAWLQHNMGDHVDFAEVARSEAGDHEGRLRIEGRRTSSVDTNSDDMEE